MVCVLSKNDNVHCPECGKEITKTGLKNHRGTKSCKINKLKKDGYIEARSERIIDVIKAFNADEDLETYSYASSQYLQKHFTNIAPAAKSNTGLYYTKKEYAQFYEHFLIFAQMHCTKVEAVRKKDNYLIVRKRPGQGYREEAPDGKSDGEGVVRYYQCVRDIGNKYVFWKRNSIDDRYNQASRAPYGNFAKLPAATRDYLLNCLFTLKNRLIAARPVKKSSITNSILADSAASQL